MHPLTPLEAQADAAIKAGDLEAIMAFADQLDALDSPRSTPELLPSALWYASVGLHIFPLTPGTKIPLKGSNGCLDATTDEGQIRAWWAATPQANIGLATGHVVDVVDVDGIEGQRSRDEHWDSIFAKIDADNIGKVLTPRKGGMHIYVPATGDGNSTNIVPSVDYRGVGGYVVCPPSRTDVGIYRWLGTPRFTDLAVSA